MATGASAGRARSGGSGDPGRTNDGDEAECPESPAVEALLRLAEERQVAAQPVDGGGRFVDCGITARGGLLAGLDLARICLAGWPR